MTTADLIKLVRLRIGEPTEKRWLDSEILTYLNEAQDILVAEELLDAELWRLTRITTLPISSGANWIRLPYDFLRERYVLYGDTAARRISLQDFEELGSNVFYEQQPFYMIADNRIYFYATTNETMATLYYVRRPMYEKVLTQQINTTLTVPAHGFTNSDIGSQIVVEEASEQSGTVNGVVQTIAAIVDVDTIQVGAIVAQATGGRILHLAKGQITSSAAPLISEALYPLLVHWATLRCREQQWEWGERERLLEHFREQIELVKRRYVSSKLPYDGQLGDVALRNRS